MVNENRKFGPILVTVETIKKGTSSDTYDTASAVKFGIDYRAEKTEMSLGKFAFAVIKNV